ncbi:MAG: quinolinate phosphoribosyl transferase [Gemmatimonadaceae bacterium]
MTTPTPLPAGLSDSPELRHRLLHERMRAFPASLFQFDPRMSEGWYTDRYFARTANTLAFDGRDPVVTMQVFAKQHGIIAGAYEVIRMLQTQLAAHPRSKQEYSLADFTVETLMDGDPLTPGETTMLVTGPYIAFAHLETDYLGVLARRSLVATNVRRVIDAAQGKPVIFMGARHDDWRVQTPDGYAARVGGAGSVSSDAGGAWWGASGVGTMPHAMIAAYGGSVVDATLAFTRYCREREPDVSVVSLVDYHNDVVRDALAVARAMHATFGAGSLAGVRVDTSERLVDVSLSSDAASRGRDGYTGVNPELVLRLRGALDQAGFAEVGIIVSGGFTPAKIRSFEAERVPVVGYGVGSSLLGHNDGEDDGLLNDFDFTADIVMVDGRVESKVGRGFAPNGRLVKVDLVGSL